MTSRSTALEMAVLGLLHDAPMHGYELRKQLIGLLGWGRVLSYGTLYPCLKSLVRDGFLDAEGTSGGRNRIEYTLTTAAKQRFVALVAGADDSADGFVSKLNAANIEELQVRWIPAIDEEGPQ